MLPSQWLPQHPKIAKALFWEGGRSRPIGYANWPATRQRQLDAIYTGKAKVPSDPPVNLLTPADDADADTRIDEDSAWALYLSYVAASLGCEIDRRVPWSILDYPAAALAVLLDARQMFDRRVEAGSPAGYQFNFGKSGFVLPAGAADSLAFLKDAGIWPTHRGIQPVPLPLPVLDPALARRKTVFRMVDWCRKLVHFFGGFEASTAESHWQYRGYAPAIRMMRQTARSGTGDTAHWTAGCWGTVGFVRSVLRAINIPVELRHPGSHAQPWFPLEGLGLCHGDDPYCRRQQYLPGQAAEFTESRAIWDAVFPADELFIDAARYDALFGSGLPLETLDRNVSATLRAIAVKYLPYGWLRARCNDLADPAKTEVFDYFGGYLSEAELQAMQLRERLDAKIASIGGCSVFG
jgi:hypothetical protein